MRFSVPLLVVFLPIFVGSVSALTSAELRSKSALIFKGNSEFNPKAYKDLAALRKILEPNTPTRTKPFRGGVAAKAKGGANMKDGDRRMTNAQRLSMGLAPNPPQIRDRHRRQAPSAVPVPPRVESRVARVADSSGQSLGYIGSTLSISGQFATTPNSGSAAGFSIKYPAGSTTPTQLRIETTSADRPALALLNGRDNIDANLGPGSWHYLYIGTTALPTAPGSLPVVTDNSFTDNTGLDTAVESDVWNYNPVTGALSATWINADGTAVPVFFYEQNGALLALADPAAFLAQYPDPITPFTWTMAATPVL